MSDITPLNHMNSTKSGQNNTGNPPSKSNFESLNQYPDSALAEAIAKGIAIKDAAGTPYNQDCMEIYYPVSDAETETFKSVKIYRRDSDGMVTMLSFSENCHLVYGSLDGGYNPWFLQPLPEDASLKDVSCYIDQVCTLSLPLLNDQLNNLKYSQEIIKENMSRPMSLNKTKDCEPDNSMEVLDGIEKLKEHIKSIEFCCKKKMDFEKNPEHEEMQHNSLQYKCKWWDSIFDVFCALYDQDEGDPLQYESLLISLKNLFDSLVMDVENQYRHLFTGNGIEYCGTPEKTISNFTQVEMDEVGTTYATDKLGLVTYNLGPCIAFAVRGEDSNGKVFLGLAHYSHYPEPDKFLEYITSIIKEKFGTSNLTINLVGGMATFGENWRNDGTPTLAEEVKLLSLAKKYNITAVRLHPAHSEDKFMACNVALDKDSTIFWFTSSDSDTEFSPEQRIKATHS